jgi:hypothetical protein
MLRLPSLLPVDFVRNDNYVWIELLNGSNSEIAITIDVVNQNGKSLLVYKPVALVPRSTDMWRQYFKVDVPPDAFDSHCLTVSVFTKTNLGILSI